jgi:2,5-diamino-6-(ribosylamino)-4(3H)-pyrimidinone 5'-phosphate reductase
MSADGKIALANKTPYKISNEEDMNRMFHLRNEVDAVLVGIETLILDNPKLTVKKKYVENPNQPLRIVLDSKCRVPNDSNILDKKAKTIIFTAENCMKKFGENVEVIKCKSYDNGLINLEYMLEILYNRGIEKLMVEGGGTVIWNFIKRSLFDEIFVYIAPIIIGGRFTPTIADGEGFTDIQKLISLKINKISQLGNGVLMHYKI